MPSRKTVSRPELRRTHVDVVFPSGGRTYTYNCDFYVSLGDHVVVETPSGITTVKVVAIHEHFIAGYKSVIPFSRLQSMEKEKQNRERRFEILKRLNAIDREHSDMQRFTRLARVSPEAKKLLSELKGL